MNVDEENFERPKDNFDSHTFTEIQSNDDEDNYNENINIDIADLDITDEEREELIIQLALTNPEQLLDSLQNLLLRYNDTENDIFLQTIEKICTSNNTPFITKFQCAKYLPSGDLLYKIVKSLDINDLEISHTILWDSLLFLIEKGYDVTENCKEFLSSSKLHIEYKYNLIRNINNQVNLDIIKEILFTFMDTIDQNNLIFYIFGLQSIKKANLLTEDYCKQCYQNYFSSNSINDNLKADFADFLISTNYPDCKEIAKHILSSLSGDISSLYHNKQNVHILNADIKQFTILLQSVLCKKSEKETLDLIYTDCKTNNQRISIKRIQLDNGLYESYTLSTILYRLYWFIDNHQCKDELFTILYEELNEEPNSCSSGHLLRLMNVLNGYTSFISVDPRIELRDSFNHKLTQFIKQSKHMDKIMESIEEQNEEYIIKYLYTYISEIRNILIEDYKNILDVEIIEEEIRKNTIQFTIKEI